MKRRGYRSVGRAATIAVILSLAATAPGMAQAPAAAKMDGAATASALPRVPLRTAPLDDTARALHLLSRATFGPTREALAEVLKVGPTAWLERQLHPERVDDSALDERLAAYPAATMDVAALYRAFPPPNAAQRRERKEAQAAKLEGDSAMAGAATTPVKERSGRRGPAAMIGQMAGAKLVRAVYSERQLQEVMTDFWFNHFNVFVGKGVDRYMVAAYEREAIRPFVFGRFGDMLKATAQHPAMLFYLDNWRNAAVDSAAPDFQRQRQRLQRFLSLTADEKQRLVSSGRVTQQQLDRLEEAARNAGKRTPGLNENYARELMELHTLGVDGGYTQRDVIEVARAFTGWTITRPRAGAKADPASDGVHFVFRPELHDRQEKVVLGTPLRAGRGIEDGLDVLHMLATSPATARHIARELAVRFVADDPPQALVDRLAKVFLDTGGDLREVTRTLFTSPEFDDPRTFQAKVKTPLELVASALRASGADVQGPSRALLGTLRTLGELPYAYSFPSGYPAASDEWVNSGAMLNRMNFALALAAGRLDHVRVDPRSLLAGDDVASTPVPVLAAALLPGRDTDKLQATVAAQLAKQPGLDPRTRTIMAAGLLLGSPDFQRR